MDFVVVIRDRVCNNDNGGTEGTTNADDDVIIRIRAIKTDTAKESVVMVNLICDGKQI